MKKVVIVSACRTAIGAFGGTLKDVPAAELGALVVKEAVSRAAILPGSLRAHGSFAKSFEKVQSEMRMQ